MFTRLLQDAPKRFILTIKDFSYLRYFTQQEESKCQDQEEEAREGQEAAWAQVDLEGHLQEGPAPAFSGQEAAGLGRAPAAFMAARGIMVPAVFTAVPGTIMALVCPSSSPSSWPAVGLWLWPAPRRFLGAAPASASPAPLLRRRWRRVWLPHRDFRFACNRRAVLFLEQLGLVVLTASPAFSWPRLLWQRGPFF